MPGFARCKKKGEKEEGIPTSDNDCARDKTVANILPNDRGVDQFGGHMSGSVAFPLSRQTVQEAENGNKNLIFFIDYLEEHVKNDKSSN